MSQMTNSQGTSATEAPLDPLPPPLEEAELTTVWPSIAATALGRLVGRLCAVEIGVGRFFTVGKLLAVATIPLSLAAFAWKLMPYVCRRYTLTNRRLVIRRGLQPVDEKSIELDAFDAIDVEVLPGQRWLRAGDVVFRRGRDEVFRLRGVLRPEPFRRTCLTARFAQASARDVLRRQAAEHP